MIEETARDQQNAAPQRYLDADFAKELNFQLWVTKGARFNAGRRLQMKQKWSTYTITALALYAITANLLTVYGIAGAPGVNTQLAFGSSIMSILILIISLLEGSRRYNLHAHLFHDCARAISRCYRELRRLRTSAGDGCNEDEVRRITEEYEEILNRCENHEDIDYLLMQVKKSDWFETSWRTRSWIRCRWYLQTLFLYQAAIVGPPVLFILARNFKLSVG